MTDYAHFMQKALDQAGRALSAGEFPVGCVIEYKGQIIATGSRTGTTRNHFNEVDHAEIIALRRLYNKKIDKGRATIFCTLEPCLMCLGAVAISQVGKIVYGYEDVMGGAAGCDLTKLTPLYSKQKILIVPFFPLIQYRNKIVRYNKPSNFLINPISKLIVYLYIEKIITHT